MSSFLIVLLELVVEILLDPVVLGGAVVLTLALCSGLVARVMELFEKRPPLRARTTEEPTSATVAR